ncbi:hypothetical protein ACP4OV_011740 [Aristida adscensionis]
MERDVRHVGVVGRRRLRRRRVARGDTDTIELVVDWVGDGLAGPAMAIDRVQWAGPGSCKPADV